MEFFFFISGLPDQIFSESWRYLFTGAPQCIKRRYGNNERRNVDCHMSGKITKGFPLIEFWHESKPHCLQACLSIEYCFVPVNANIIKLGWDYTLETGVIMEHNVHMMNKSLILVLLPYIINSLVTVFKVFFWRAIFLIWVGTVWEGSSTCISQRTWGLWL